MKAKSLFIGLLVMVFIPILTLSSPAEGAEFKIIYGSEMPEKHVTSKAAIWMADEMQKRSKGRIEVVNYFGGAIGRAVEMLDGVKSGDIDIVFFHPAHFSRAGIKPMSIISVSYLLKDLAHYKKVFAKNSTPTKLMAKYVEKSPLDMKFLGMIGGIARQLFNSKRPINTPDDLKGLKIRVIKSPIEAKVWSALGAIPVQLSWSEIYTGLQTGVVQGAECSIDSYFVMKFNEQAQHFAFTNHQFVAMPLVMSKKNFNKMPPDLQKVVLDVGYETAELSSKLYNESQKNLVNQAKAKGIKFSYPDTELFKAKVAQIMKTAATDYNAQDLFKAINDLR
ncbi:TRAP transporter substrate-binding protein [Thermodesulfobacteriota bacterium]